VDSTEELAKNTMALSRATGMDTKTSSAWAELLKVRGIDTGKFQVGMVKLSKTMEAARGGNEKRRIATGVRRVPKTYGKGRRKPRRSTR
jgi:hypothetical protein